MSVLIRNLGLKEYLPVLKDMQNFTINRNNDTPDEIWLVEHPPVYTLGLNGKREHLIKKNTIPVIAADRGGQITYHGPGQTVAYTLCDLERMKTGVSEFVNKIEQSIINLLYDYTITSARKKGAPGVYIKGCKIAALGLRIKRGRSYHGLSLNVDMDLAPFEDINPCGYPGLEVTQLKDLGVNEDMLTINTGLIEHLKKNLGYNDTL